MNRFLATFLVACVALTALNVGGVGAVTATAAARGARHPALHAFKLAAAQRALKAGVVPAHLAKEFSDLSSSLHAYLDHVYGPRVNPFHVLSGKQTDVPFEDHFGPRASLEWAGEREAFAHRMREHVRAAADVAHRTLQHPDVVSFLQRDAQHATKANTESSTATTTTATTTESSIGDATVVGYAPPNSRVLSSDADAGTPAFGSHAEGTEYVYQAAPNSEAYKKERATAKRLVEDEHTLNRVADIKSALQSGVSASDVEEDLLAMTGEEGPINELARSLLQNNAVQRELEDDEDEWYENLGDSVAQELKDMGLFGLKHLVPTIVVFTYSGGVGPVVGGCDFVIDWYRGQTGLFSFGGVSVGSDMTSIAELEGAIGFGSKGEALDSNIDAAYSGWFIGGDIKAQVPLINLNGGFSWAVSASSGTHGLPVPTLSMVKTLSPSAGIGAGDALPFKANLAATYYHTLHMECFSDMIKLVGLARGLPVLEESVDLQLFVGLAHWVENMMGWDKPDQDGVRCEDAKKEYPLNRVLAGGDDRTFLSLQQRGMSEEDALAREADRPVAGVTCASVAGKSPAALVALLSPQLHNEYLTVKVVECVQARNDSILATFLTQLDTKRALRFLTGERHTQIEALLVDHGIVAVKDASLATAELLANEVCGSMGSQLGANKERWVYDVLERLMDGSAGSRERAALSLLKCFLKHKQCDVLARIDERIGKDKLLRWFDWSRDTELRVTMSYCGVWTLEDLDDDAAREYVRERSCAQLNEMPQGQLSTLMRHMDKGFTGHADSKFLLKIIECSYRRGCGFMGDRLQAYTGRRDGGELVGDMSGVKEDKVKVLLHKCNFITWDQMDDDATRKYVFMSSCSELNAMPRATLATIADKMLSGITGNDDELALNKLAMCAAKECANLTALLHASGGQQRWEDNVDGHEYGELSVVLSQCNLKSVLEFNDVGARQWLRQQSCPALVALKPEPASEEGGKPVDKVGAAVGRLLKGWTGQEDEEAMAYTLRCFEKEGACERLTEVVKAATGKSDAKAAANDLRGDADGKEYGTVSMSLFRCGLVDMRELGWRGAIQFAQDDIKCRFSKSWDAQKLADFIRTALYTPLVTGNDERMAVVHAAQCMVEHEKKELIRDADKLLFPPTPRQRREGVQRTKPFFLELMGSGDAFKAMESLLVNAKMLSPADMQDASAREHLAAMKCSEKAELARSDPRRLGDYGRALLRGWTGNADEASLVDVFRCLQAEDVSCADRANVVKAMGGWEKLKSDVDESLIPATLRRDDAAARNNPHADLLLTMVDCESIMPLNELNDDATLRYMREKGCTELRDMKPETVGKLLHNFVKGTFTWTDNQEEETINWALQCFANTHPPQCAEVKRVVAAAGGQDELLSALQGKDDKVLRETLVQCGMLDYDALSHSHLVEHIGTFDSCADLVQRYGMHGHDMAPRSVDARVKTSLARLMDGWTGADAEKETLRVVRCYRSEHACERLRGIVAGLGGANKLVANFDGDNHDTIQNELLACDAMNMADMNDDATRAFVAGASCDKLANVAAAQQGELVKNMVEGTLSWVGGDDERSILKVLDCAIARDDQCATFKSIVKTAGQSRLESKIDGDNYDQFVWMELRCGLKTDAGGATADVLNLLPCDKLKQLPMAVGKTMVKELFDGITSGTDERAVLRYASCLDTAAQRKQLASKEDMIDELGGHLKELVDLGIITEAEKKKEEDSSWW